MERLQLTDTGELFIRAMKNCLSWLAIGGDIKLASEHTIVMDQLGRPGFLVDSYDGKTKETTQMIMQLDYDLVWGFLVDYARKMTEEDLIKMSMNLALNYRES